MKTEVQKIVPGLWFDKNCDEAMNFYVSAFSGLSGEIKKSKIISIKRYEKGMETPGIDEMTGKVLNGIFELEGYRFLALDGGPLFKFNPSVSFMVNFNPSKNKNARKNLNALWSKFLTGGKIMLELQKYEFSELYGWIQDKYGISWQLMLTDPKGESRPFIAPCLMFAGDIAGKAEEAVDFYLSVFENSKRGMLERYPAGMDPEKQGTVMFSDFMIDNQWFAAMDSARTHGFSFNEAISFIVNCDDQAEVDSLWSRLSSVPDSEICGWLKDKYGFSWQIVPRRLGELISDPDSNKANRVLNTMLHMKKIEIKELEEAYAHSGAHVQ